MATVSVKGLRPEGGQLLYLTVWAAFLDRQQLRRSRWYACVAGFSLSHSLGGATIRQPHSLVANGFLIVTRLRSHHFWFFNDFLLLLLNALSTSRCDQIHNYGR